MFSAFGNVSRNDVVSGLIAISIPLIQIIGFTFNSFLKSLALNEFFLYPDFLPLVNAFSILITLGGIGGVWYWKEKQFHINFRTQGERPRPPMNQERATFRLFLQLSIFAGLSIIVLMATTILNAGAKNVLVALFQYVAYFLAIVFSGLVLYLALHEYAKKIDMEKQQDLVTNLSVSLRRSGVIPEPTIRIDRNESDQDQPNSYVRNLELTIDGKRYKLRVRYDGKEIYSVEQN